MIDIMENEVNNVYVGLFIRFYVIKNKKVKFVGLVGLIFYDL